MKDFLTKCVDESFPSKTMRFIRKKWHFLVEKSIFCKYLQQVLRCLTCVIKHSAFIAYFSVEKTRWDDFFKDSLIVNSIKSMLFGLLAGLYNLFSKAFRGSFAHVLMQNISDDWKKRSIRHLAWFLFGFLSIFGIFQLLWGKGFNRDEMTYAFLALAFLWIISHVAVPSSWFSEKSTLLEYLRGLIS